MTRVGSRKLTPRPAFGGDDNAFPTCGLRTQARRFLWVTLSAHKWVILGERRGPVFWAEDLSWRTAVCRVLVGSVDSGDMWAYRTVAGNGGRVCTCFFPATI